MPRRVFISVIYFIFERKLNMTAMTEEQKQQILLERFLARMEKEPLDVQHSVVHYAENLMNGCNWAFISAKNPSFAKETESFKNSKLVSVYEVKNGVLITTPMETILTILTRVSPELYDAKAKQAALEFRKKSQEGFVNFLRSGVTEARIAIYNLNDSPNITINGKVYKAFNVDLATAAMFLRDAGYAFVIDDKVLPAENVLVKERFAAAHKVFELAPSGNGLMVDIKKVR